MTIHFADGTTQTTAPKFKQVVTSQVTSHTACTPDTQLVFKDIPISVSITPSSSSSKILISFMLFGEHNNNSKDHYFRIKRAISGGSTTFISGADQGNRVGTLMIGGMGLEDGSGDSYTNHGNNE